MVTNWPKYPLRVSKYFQLLYVLFFIISKTTAIGITEIGQAIKKLVNSETGPNARPRSPCARPRPVSSTVHPVLTKCATSYRLCDQMDHLCGRALGKAEQKLRNWVPFVPITPFSIVLSKLSVFRLPLNSVCTLREFLEQKLINNSIFPYYPY